MILMIRWILSIPPVRKPDLIVFTFTLLDMGLVRTGKKQDFAFPNGLRCAEIMRFHLPFILMPLLNLEFSRKYIFFSTAAGTGSSVFNLYHQLLAGPTPRMLRKVLWL